jgi:tRNA A-37 threonylcarbamoyl transferase component Bud32
MSSEKDEVDRHHLEEHREFFREVLLRVNEIMEGKYHLHDVSVRPLGAGGARLSLPVKIEGMGPDGLRERYFGKILGSSDLMTAKTMQLMKNLYLETNSHEPLFGFAVSSEQMARHQFDQMGAIHRLGIPTAMPYGYHPLKGQLWLFVTQFLEAAPLPEVKILSEDQINTIFGYLEEMHHHGIFHGDLKPENILIGDRIYIQDIGHFLDSAPMEEKIAYDLASMICSMVQFATPEVLVRSASKYYKRKQLSRSEMYLELIQRRPDFYFDASTMVRLSKLLKG